MKGELTRAALYCNVQSTAQQLTNVSRLWVGRQGQEGRTGSPGGWDSAAGARYEEALLGAGCEVSSAGPLVCYGPVQVYLSYKGQGPQHFFVSRADQASALAGLMEEVMVIE